MKDYFKFNLKAQKLLPVWIAFMVLFIIPYVFIIVNIKDILGPHQASKLLQFYGIILLLVTVAYAIIFYVIKLTIEGVEFRGKSLVFEGTFGQFIVTFITGLLLTIITLGIYYPWFITKIQKFFIDNTSHDSNKLEFAGTGGKLFKILFFCMFLPLVAMIIIMAYIQITSGAYHPASVSLYTNLFTIVLMIPYMYYFYKWRVNIKISDYTIRWETTFWNSCGKLVLELFLSIITLGIYYPYAALRLYKYFMERTYAVSESRKRVFGYELEGSKDFLFLWGQLLLTVITLGIYYPWAGCKVTDRILSKTYVEQITE
jgi:Predicted membrane protein